MSQDNIKNFRTSSITVNGSNFQAYLNASVIGYVQRVAISANAAGSVIVAESGTNHQLALLTTTSGTNATYEAVYPRRAVELFNGVATAGSNTSNYLTPPLCMGNVVVTGSGFVSGTNHSVSYVEVTWQ